MVLGLPWRPRQSQVLWSHFLGIAIASYTPTTPQHDMDNQVSLCIMIRVSLDRLECREYTSGPRALKVVGFGMAIGGPRLTLRYQHLLTNLKNILICQKDEAMMPLLLTDWSSWHGLEPGLKPGLRV